MNSVSHGGLVRGRQLTIGGLLVVIALAGALVNWFRPITAVEAASIAERRFRAIPGAADLAGRHRAHPRFTDGGNGKNYWCVNIVDLRSGEPLAQVSLDPRGKLESTVVAFPLGAAPVPGD